MERTTVYQRFPEQVEDASYEPYRQYQDLLSDLEDAETTEVRNRTPSNNFIFGLAITTALFASAYFKEDSWFNGFVRSVFGDSMGGIVAGTGFVFCALFALGVIGNILEQRGYRRAVERAEDRLLTFRIGLMILKSLERKDGSDGR